MKNFNVAPLVAFLRHLGSYSAGLVTALALAGMDHDQAVKLTNAIVAGGGNLADILAIAGPAVGGALAWWSAQRNTKAEQIKAVEKMPEIATVVVKDEANGKIGKLAQDDAHPNIVTETQNEADAKQGTKT